MRKPARRVSGEVRQVGGTPWQKDSAEAREQKAMVQLEVSLFPFGAHEMR